MRLARRAGGALAGGFTIEAFRDSARALTVDKIAPRAAEIDRAGEFPWDVYEILVKAGRSSA